jgi:signal transduction histidine kinase
MAHDRRQAVTVIDSYAGRLRLALLTLALPAVGLAALGWYVLDQSQYRVERGRIASDIYTALTVFDLEKARLRGWSYRQALDGAAPPDQRDAILTRMQAQMAAIAAKADLAAALDAAQGKDLAEHAERQALLAFLAEVQTKLERETGLLLAGDAAQVTDTEAEAARLAGIDAEFDQLRGVALADALAAALRNEAGALERERVRADQSLAAARSLFLSAGGFALIAALGMALLLARRLRQPIEQLDQGLRAYGAGDFTYRFDGFHDQEFRRLALLLNAMAEEVDAARQRAARDQAALESTVASRTADLRRTLDELAASEGARQKLLADIGHELRTPVTVIRGEAQVALRRNGVGATLGGGGGDVATAALLRIVDVTRQMEHLIEDLLVLVRDPAGQPVVMPRRIALSQALRPAVDSAQVLAAQRGVVLHLPDPLPDLMVEADPDRLRQVMLCLLDNGLRYSHPGGRVDLEVAQLGDDVQVRIRDQGIGIAPSDMPHLFARGWRAPAARAHRPDGLGLGLVIARQLTHAQGGRLDIGPGPDGKGVCAALTLPLAIPGTEGV